LSCITIIGSYNTTVMQIPHIEKESAAASISGALLAGGKSRRMGQDKALLKVCGEMLWQRNRNILQSLCDEVFIAGERPDLASEDCPAHADLNPGSALAGLQTALVNARHDWVVVLPCDLPFPSPRLLQALIDARQGQQVVVPETAAGFEPLVGCYHRSLLPIIERQLERGNFRIFDFYPEVRTRTLGETELPPGWRRALTNLNRPDQLERILAPPPTVTFVARSGTGKTTLVIKLITELTRRGWTVGALKHDAHRFQVDKEGKDSWRMTQAGAAITAVSSPEQTAVMERHELPPPAEELLKPFGGKVDMVLTEGFKRSSLPKIEAHRAELNRPLLCRGDFDDPALIAVASDVKLQLDVPCFDLNNEMALADFIEERFLK